MTRAGAVLLLAVGCARTGPIPGLAPPAPEPSDRERGDAIRSAYISSRDLTPEIRRGILARTVSIGMSREDVRAVLAPDRDIAISTAVTPDGEEEVWSLLRSGIHRYPYTWVSFHDGLVISFGLETDPPNAQRGGEALSR